MSNQKTERNKEPRSEETNENDEINSSSSQSFASRLSHSASSLSRDVFSGGPSASTSTLASSLAASEKSQQAYGPSSSASAGPSTWAQSGRLETHGPNGRAGKAALQNGFRSAPPRSIDSEIERAGYGGGARVSFLPPAHVDYRVASWTGQFLTAEERLSNSSTNKSHAVASSDDISAVETQDGMEVVDLLNDHSALADESMLRADFEGAQDVSADELFNQPLSASEQDVKGKMKAALPPPPEHGLIDPLNPSNFHANVEMLHMTTPIVSTGLSHPPDPSVAYYSMHEDRAEWMRQWLDEWEGVLRNYTDEVWGGSLPQVEEARKEIETMKNDESKWDDRQAVRRLEMILRHIRVPSMNGSGRQNNR